jgi:hypothetical protein
VYPVLCGQKTLIFIEMHGTTTTKKKNSSVVCKLIIYIGMKRSLIEDDECRQKLRIIT